MSPRPPIAPAEMARLAIGLTLPSPSGAALTQELPSQLLSQLPQLLTSLLMPQKSQFMPVRQWLLAAVGARLQQGKFPLPAPLAQFLDALSDDQKKLLSDGLGRLEQAQVQSRQDTLFWALPLPFVDDWLEMAWPKTKQEQDKQKQPMVLTLLFPIPNLGRLLVKAGVNEVRFYADSERLKARVDETLPRLASRLADLDLTPSLMSFQGKVPKKLIPPVGGINEMV